MKLASVPPEHHATSLTSCQQVRNCSSVSWRVVHTYLYTSSFISCCLE